MKNFSLTIFFLAIWSISCFAADLRVTWSANTEPDLAGYRVYYVAPGQTEWQVVDVGNVTTHDIADIGQGQHTVAVSAYDQVGNESELSPFARLYYIPAVKAVAPDNQYRGC